VTRLCEGQRASVLQLPASPEAHRHAVDSHQDERQDERESLPL
jgi:hypothetical protein